MSSDRPPPPTGREWLAAERALGLLEGAELEEARRLETGDPAFAREVARWSARFAPMLDSIPPAEPPANAYRAIERRLLPNDNVISLRQRIRRWQVATAGMAAIAASLALIVLVPTSDYRPVSPDAVPRSEPMVAMLEGGRNQLIATWNGGDRSLIVVPAAVDAADVRHSHELWMIPADGTPRSLGVMPDGPMHLEVTPATAAMLTAGATIAVSVEPTGGSPTGLPTGPVIASGPLKRA